MKRFADFKAFSKAGRDLAHWHLNYETVECYAGVEIEGDTGTPARKGGSELRARVPASLYRVEKMKLANFRDPETNEWVMERQSVSKDNVQRHHQRRQPLGHRNHEQPRLPPRTLPPRHHSEPGDDEDRGGTAEAGDLTCKHSPPSIRHG